MKYGTEIMVKENVQYIGDDGWVPDPLTLALHVFHQPERLNPEDASDSVCDSLNTTNK